MEHLRQINDAGDMAKLIRVLAVTLTTGVALLMLYWAYVFGRCEGWKGTGTCPRVPLWDWEMFWIVFWAGVLPTIALRVQRHRLLRTAVEALAAGATLGAIVVIATAF